MIKVQINRNNSWLCEAGYTEEEEKVLFKDTLQDVLDNTRWYLDNLDYIREYKVSWQCYSKRYKNGTNSITFIKE